MVTFNIKDLEKIYPTDELVEALSTHKGVVPMCLNFYINWEKYDKNLKTEGIYDEVYKEYYKIRVNYKKTKDKKRFKKNQLSEWLDKYPKFVEILHNAIID